MPDLQPHLDLGGYVLDTIDIAERKGFEEHLLLCDQCQLDLQRMTDLKSMLVDVMGNLPVVHAPIDLRDRTLTAIDEAPGGNGGGKNSKQFLWWIGPVLGVVVLVTVLLLAI